MTMEFWTTIIFEAWILILALLLAGHWSENDGSLFFFCLTWVKEPVRIIDF